MKTTLVKTSQGFITVSDQPIKEGDTTFMLFTKDILGSPITASTYMQNTNAKKLTFSDEVAKTIGFIDIDKLAHEYSLSVHPREEDNTGHMFENTESDFIAGFNKSQSINEDKKWTDEDMERAIDMARETQPTNANGDIPKYGRGEIIPSLTQSDWEVEIEETENEIKVIRIV